MKSRMASVLLFLFLFISFSSSLSSQSCYYHPGTRNLKCCDRLLYKFSSPRDAWSLHNMMIPNSVGSGSGGMNQYRTLPNGTLVYRSKTIGNSNPSAAGLSLSNFGPQNGVDIPDLPYVKPWDWVDSLRFELKTNGTRGVFASYSGCNPDRSNPGASPCVNSDGYLFFLSPDGADYPEETLTVVPDTRRFGPHYDGVAGSYNASPDSLGCIGNPCWRAPKPAPYSAISSTENLKLYGQSRDGQGTPNSIDSLCGPDYSLCRGQKLYPRWAIITHWTNGWFRQAYREWWITGLEVWGCVAPTGLFYTVPPCRLLDTREDGYPVLGTRTVQVYGNCGIPTTARSIVGNVTVVGLSSGHLALLPLNDPASSVSTINYTAGQTRANNFTVGIEPQNGMLKINTDKYGTLEVSAHVIIDVTGYYE